MTACRHKPHPRTPSRRPAVTTQAASRLKGGGAWGRSSLCARFRRLPLALLFPSERRSSASLPGLRDLGWVWSAADTLAAKTLQAGRSWRTKRRQHCSSTSAALHLAVELQPRSGSKPQAPWIGRTRAQFNPASQQLPLQRADEPCIMLAVDRATHFSARLPELQLRAQPSPHQH